MFKNQVEQLLQTALDERKNLFLIDFSISPSNAIKIVIDGDNGVLVEDCMFISRAIEHNLDRDDIDFSIEVLSSGATANLVQLRQYHKHIGRTLTVTTIEDIKFEGKLTEVNDTDISLQWKAREAKPKGKGKVTVTKKERIAFETIKEAKVKITF